jgi:predicted sugar kinase
LIFEKGKLKDEEVAEVALRRKLPEAWRFVLVRPRGMEGVWGEAEIKAFCHLPASDVATTQRLTRLAEQGVVLAARQGDIATFGRLLTEYNRLAGSWYEEIQRGPYLNAEVAALVDRLDKAGAFGVGQSSWGPTVFAVMPDEAAAAKLLIDAGLTDEASFESQIVPPRNQGFEVTAE